MGSQPRPHRPRSSTVQQPTIRIANMNYTDLDKQIIPAIRQSAVHHTDRSTCRISNVIPFPAARASHQIRENTESARCGNTFANMLRRIKDAVSRLTHSPDELAAYTKRKSTIHYPDFDQPEAWGNGHGFRQNSDIRMNLLNR